MTCLMICLYYISFSNQVQFFTWPGSYNFSCCVIDLGTGKKVYISGQGSFYLTMKLTNGFVKNWVCKEVHNRVSLCVVGVETFFSIQLEQHLCAVLFAMQSPKCHLLVFFFFLSLALYELYSLPMSQLTNPFNERYI